MSRGKVEFVLTAEDTKAMVAATKLLAKVRETGDAFNEAGNKGKNSMDGIGGAVVDLALKFAGPTMAVKAFNDMLDLAKQKVEAIQQAQERASAVSKTYGEAFGRIAANIPGISQSEASTIDTTLRQISAQSALGEGGLIKIADAYAQIQSSIPLAPQQAKFDAVRETAQMLELSPTENATGIGLGIAKIMEASGFQYSANQAQNLLRQQQTLGLVKDVAPIGQSIPKLGSAAQMGGVGLADMQAFAAYATQAMGDTGGEEATTAIQAITAQIMTRGVDIEAKMGLRPDGDLFERLGQIRQKYQAGEISEDELGKLLPVISRGGGGKMLMMSMLGGGWDKLNEYRKIMNDPSIQDGDYTGSDIATIRGTLGPQEWQFQQRKNLSTSEANRAGDEESAREDFFRRAFESKLRRERQTAKFTGQAMDTFDMVRQGGWALSEAELAARHAGGRAEWPVIGGMYADAITAPALRMQMRMEAKAESLNGKPSPYRADPEKDMAYYLAHMAAVMEETRDAVKNQTSTRATPRSVLSTGGLEQ